MEYSVGSISKLISSAKPNKSKKASKRKAEKIPEEIVEEVEEKKIKTGKKSKKEKKQKIVEPEPEETSDNEIENSDNQVENSDSEDEESTTAETPEVSFTIEKDGGLSGDDDDEFDEEDASDSEDDEDEKSNKKKNGKDSKDKEEKKPLTEAEMAEECNKYNDRTVFVGNLPLTVQKNKLKKLFEKFGRVESVRLRGAPTADPRVPKKVAMIKKQFHKDRTSFHGYVRFAEREDALKSVEMNGHDFNGHHLRVNMCDVTEKPDQNKAIFLGNVSFEAEEEELWNLFEPCGEIASVRLVRDRKTNVGKGFGYVNFKSSDAVELALQMGNVVLRKRQLRISACDTKKPKKKFDDKKIKNKDSRPADGGKKFERKNDGNSFHGKEVTDKKKKKFNKSTQQKKKLVKKIAPKVKA